MRVESNKEKVLLIASSKFTYIIWNLLRKNKTPITTHRNKKIVEGMSVSKFRLIWSQHINWLLKWYKKYKLLSEEQLLGYYWDPKKDKFVEILYKKFRFYQASKDTMLRLLKKPFKRSGYTQVMEIKYD